MRYPNPWVFMPSLLGGAVGGLLGWVVADLSDTATSGKVIAATSGFIVAALGVGIVAVLAIRSFDEWREASARGGPLPTAGCEAPKRLDPAEDQSDVVPPETE